MLFAACTTDVTKDVTVEVPQTLTVSFEEDTRIQLMNGKTVWNTGDLVSVFYKSDANDCYRFAGNTGERTSELVRTAKGEKSRSGDHIITVYPYSEDYIISLSAGTIEAHLPAEQTYVNESFGIGSSPMVSMSDYKQVVLKNVCGWLKVQFTGNGEVVDKITLRGNCGEQVAGDIMIVAEDASTILASAGMDIDDTEVGGTLVDEDSIITEVSLICPDGVTLGSEPTSFYIALPPQTFSNGLTVTLYSDKSGAMKQTTDKSITISRNIVQPLASVEANLQPNKIYYTSTNGKIVTPYSTTVFGGANIVSNTYENGQGVIIFDAPVTTIGSYALGNCNSLTSVTIPDSVTEIGDEAFAYCSSLTSVTIPDSVTTVGINPFEGCSKLTEFNGKFASADKRCLIVDGVLNSFAIGCGLTEYAIPNSVTEIGNYAFSECSSLTSVTIPNSITEIGSNAFRNCSSLTSVTILDSVTTIGSHAFYGCSSLTSVSIGNSVTSIGSGAFRNCSSLTSVTIPDSVTEIGTAAFADCSSLTSVTIPDSVTTLGANPFRSCSKLTEFNGKFASADKRCLIVDGVLNSFAIGCGLTEYAIPNSVTKIGGYAFYNCSSLTSVTIPDSVTDIGYSAFEDCSSLTSVTIPDSVTDIGYSAFEDCSSLKSVYCNAAYPPTLGSSAFVNTALENIYVYAESVDTYKAKWSDYADKIVSNSKSNSDSITFTYTSTDGKAINESNLNLVVKSNSYTNGVGTLVVYGTAIPDKAFYQCTTLKTITIPDSVTTIGINAFRDCSSLTSVTIPDSVTEIGMYAFKYCSSLTSVTIPDSVTKIEGNAFSGCSSLTSVTIGNSVTKIEGYAFRDCSSLTTVTIPDSVTTIGSGAFRDCSSLKSVYCKPTTPPQGGISMFSDNATDRKIYVPASDDDSIINAYKAADYWKDYADYIEEYEFTE